MSIVLSVVFLNTLFRNKFDAYPWAQFCTPHLTRQHKIFAFFFSNCVNPAKLRS